VRHLNELHRAEPALHEDDVTPAGFEWVDASDTGASVLSWLRHPRDDGRGAPGGRPVLVVCNLTPVPRSGYRIGVPRGGVWDELANSDAVEFGGSGMGNLGRVQAQELAAHGRAWSLSLTLPPLGVLMFAPEGR
jgi:1,4-alpha-glucan branching enzyme